MSFHLIHPIAILSIFLSLLMTAHAMTTTVTIGSRIDYPTSPNRICDARGTLATLQLYTTFKALGQDIREVCANACADANFAANLLCDSWSVTPATSTCKLYNTTLEAQGFVKNAKGAKTFYYNRSCYIEQFDTQYKTNLTGPFGAADDYYKIQLPFPVKLFDNTPRTVAYMSTNGVSDSFVFSLTDHPESRFSLNTPVINQNLDFNNADKPHAQFLSLDGMPQSSYVNTQIPNFSSSGRYDYLPPISICGFWDDLEVKGTFGNLPTCADELSYTIAGRPGIRYVKFSWRATKTSDNSLIDMDIILREYLSHKVGITYNNDIEGAGDTATIGIQSQPAGKYIRYSYNQAVLSKGMSLEFDTQAGTVTAEGP